MEDLKYLARLFHEYSRIMSEESKYNDACKKFISYPAEIYGSACYLREVSRSCLLPRGWCDHFGLGGGRAFINESVGSHTHLMTAMVELLFRNRIGNPFFKNGYTKDCYDYRTVMEAIRLHDLPENEIGDWLDNGSRDEAQKSALEDQWYTSFENYHSTYDDRKLYDKARHILKDMGAKFKCGPTARMLYAADKYSLVIAALTCDMLGHSPTMCLESSKAVERDIEEMLLCDVDAKTSSVKASEMFTADILHIRKINQYDDTGFFTAILVMYTLMVKCGWYYWRENDYNNK